MQLPNFSISINLIEDNELSNYLANQIIALKGLFPNSLSYRQVILFGETKEIITKNESSLMYHFMDTFYEIPSL